MTAITIDELADNIDQFFLITMGMIVYLMQMGFAFLEAGSVRSKNTTNILMKNIMDSAIGALSYWLLGWAFAYGDKGNAFIGYSEFVLYEKSDTQGGAWFFQYVFAATAATIVSGAVAERTKFVAYLVYCVLLTAVVYPIVTHWAWDAKGWLAAECWWDDVSFMDFAGSAIVHCLGGTAALCGAVCVGRRKDLWNEAEGKYKRIAGHSVPLATFGGFILIFGFFAFNGGSVLSLKEAGAGYTFSKAVKNTALGGLTSGLVAVAINYVIGGRKFSLLTIINADLTGMVAMCAGCNVMEEWAAIVVGMVAGPTYICWSALIFKLKIDDPLDAVAVHLGGGLWGIIAAPLFAKDVGIFHNWDALGFKFLLWNIIGAVVIIAWTAAWCLTAFIILRVLGLLRVSEEDEETGLDIVCQGEVAYPKAAYGIPGVSEKA